MFGGLDDSSLDVNIQDVTSAPVASNFARELSSFSIASDTVSSTVDVLVYDVTASPAHGITIGSQLILLDVVGNRELIAQAKNVVGDVITIDRPIDHVFPTASTLGRITSSNLQVNGNVTPVIFTMRAGSIPVDIQTIVFTLEGTSAMNDGLFGAITALPKGLVFRIVDGYQKTLGVMKTNGDFKRFGADLSYVEKTGPGTHAMSAKFKIKDILGVVFRVDNDSILQVIVQDDLTTAGFTSGYVTALGQETVGEIYG